MNDTRHTESEGCRDWRKAQQSGTDNEGYGKLLSNYDGLWSMGCELQPIEYCPWCGVSLSDELVSGEPK